MPITNAYSQNTVFIFDDSSQGPTVLIGGQVLNCLSMVSNTSDSITGSGSVVIGPASSSVTPTAVPASNLASFPSYIDAANYPGLIYTPGNATLNIAVPVSTQVGGVTIAGTGIATLSAANSFAGTSSVVTGPAVFNNANAIGGNNWNVLSGGVLTIAVAQTPSVACTITVYPTGTVNKLGTTSTNVTFVNLGGTINA